MIVPKTSLRDGAGSPRPWPRAWERVALGILGCMGSLWVAGCSTAPWSPGLEEVSAGLRDRSGYDRAPGGPQDDFSLLAQEGGLSEEDAVNLALLNNAAFQEQLADLGLSRADVIGAGLLSNPDMLVLIPVGPKQTEGTITASLESLWLRDRRTKGAVAGAERTVARLSQAGLDLIRDVRLAYAELALARRRLALFEESARLWRKVAGIAESRVRAGDAAPLDAATARIDAMRGDQEVRSLTYAVVMAEEKLRAAMGAGAVRTPIVPRAVPDAESGQWDVDALVQQAVADRPDIMAAELAVEAARQRAALARIEWFNFSFVADANERGAKGFEAGPGLRFTLPIFNQNQGNLARADAELERSVRQRKTLSDRIILEVREAHVRLAQARADLAAWRGQILPALDKAVALAEKAYRGGETPLLQVLYTNRQLLDARVREAQAAADLRRARAELERSVGRRLEPRASATTSRPTEISP